MRKKAPTDLEKLRENLRGQLRAHLLAPQIDTEAVGIVSKALGATDLVMSASESAKTARAWLLPTIVGGVALIVVGIASLIHLERASIELVATASEFRFRFGPGNHELIGSLDLVPGSLLPLSAKVEAPAANYAGFSKLQNIQVLQGSEINLALVAPSCFELRLMSGQFKATVLQDGTADSTSAPWPRNIELTKTGSLRFCLSKDTALIAGGIVELLVASEVRSFPPPSLFVPSLVKGKLVVTDSAKTVALGNTDRLFIGQIENGSVAIQLQKSMEVSLAAESRRPMMFGLAGPVAGDGEDLRATFLELGTSSPGIKAFLAAIIGLAGALMGLLRWFGMSKEE